MSVTVSVSVSVSVSCSANTPELLQQHPIWNRAHFGFSCLVYCYFVWPKRFVKVSLEWGRFLDLRITTLWGEGKNLLERNKKDGPSLDYSRCSTVYCFIWHERDSCIKIWKEKRHFITKFVQSQISACTQTRRTFNHPRTALKWYQINSVELQTVSWSKMKERPKSRRTEDKVFWVSNYEVY